MQTVQLLIQKEVSAIERKGIALSQCHLVNGAMVNVEHIKYVNMALANVASVYIDAILNPLIVEAMQMYVGRVLFAWEIIVLTHNLIHTNHRKTKMGTR